MRARLDKLRAKPSETSKAVTLHDLWSFNSLARDVEKQLGKVGLSEHKPTDSDMDFDTSSPEEEKDYRHHSRCRRGKKSKSG